jgi:hypothetical protein
MENDRENIFGGGFQKYTVVRGGEMEVRKRTTGKIKI